MKGKRLLDVQAPSNGSHNSCIKHCSTATLRYLDITVNSYTCCFVKHGSDAFSALPVTITDRGLWAGSHKCRQGWRAGPAGDGELLLRPAGTELLKSSADTLLFASCRFLLVSAAAYVDALSTNYHCCTTSSIASACVMKRATPCPLHRFHASTI
jgi:hypothetical protein